MLLMFLSVTVGVGCGLASVVFLFLMGHVTAFREAHGAIVFLLPMAGLLLGTVTRRLGPAATGGTNLVIDTVTSSDSVLSPLMAPFVLIGTVVTHLFGGSAGREGTAVQMGASIGELIGARFKPGKVTRHHLLLAGVAGGFGAVFGTPLSGAVFAMEFITAGIIDLTVAAPALTAAYVGDQTARALGAEHSVFSAVSGLTLTLPLVAKWIVFAAAIAVLVATFIALTGVVQRVSKRLIPDAALRMCLAGVAVVVLWKVFDTPESLGLGLPLIEKALEGGHLPLSATSLKMVFTATTIGSGFVGGETTPLFCMGAALGNTLSAFLQLPTRLAAAVGLTSAFGAAAKTPLAVSIMAVELFGAQVFPHVALVATLAALLSAKWRLYSSQREVGASL